MGKTLYSLVENFFENLNMNTNQPVYAAESDKLCFKNSLKDFLFSGRKEDAFVVYYCFSEIFHLFGSGYENTKKLLETLSDHEYHSGELLTKHRDHYSHSVYVFSIGLAIYANDEAYRNAFLDFYKIAHDDTKSAFKFLELWGKVALFHDIGYPFQLAHEQIKTYAADVFENDNPIYVSYANINNFIKLDESIQKKIQKALNCQEHITTINQLLAYGLKIRNGYDENRVDDILLKRVIDQPKFMDHGYFSALILSKQTIASNNAKFDIEWLDVLTAILLHNNLNKYDLEKYGIENVHPININEHPLAYLLILCDELQVWDRFAYGKVSKRDPIAWDVEFELQNNLISALYSFDSCSITDVDNKVRINKSFGEIQDGIFTSKIFTYISSDLVIKASAIEKKKEKKLHHYISDDNFINLCDFAIAINASYEGLNDNEKDKIAESFSKLPLEYKVDNINLAKSYAQKLELINCFYSSKDLDYPIVNDFKDKNFGRIGSDNFGFLCREEHLRWVRDKIKNGWKYGVDYKSKDERNSKKIHKCLVPYEELSPSDRKYDEIMIENIIPMLKKISHNNIKIYSYRIGRKPDLIIAGVGHRFFRKDEAIVESLKNQIKRILIEYQKDYRVVVSTGFAIGSDQLIAECANELGLSVRAALPLPYEEFIKDVRNDALKNNQPYTDDDEMHLRLLLAQTVVCKEFIDPEHTYLAAAEYNMKKCDKLIALWDGEETQLYDEINRTPINQGGTYHCIKLAEKYGKRDSDIHIIRCHR